MSSVPQAARTAALATGWTACHDLMLRAYHLAPACRQPLFRLAPKVDLASTPEPGSPGRCARVFFFTIFFFSGSSPARSGLGTGQWAQRRIHCPTNMFRPALCQTPPSSVPIDSARRHTMLLAGLVSQQPTQQGLSLKHSTRDVPPAPMIGRGPHMDRCPFRRGACRQVRSCMRKHSVTLCGEHGRYRAQLVLAKFKPSCGCAPLFPRRTQRVRIRPFAAGATVPELCLFTLHQP